MNRMKISSCGVEGNLEIMFLEGVWKTAVIVSIVHCDFGFIMRVQPVVVCVHE